MTTRQNLTIYNETDLVEAITKYQKKEDLPNYTAACTKLIKKSLRDEGLLEAQK